MPAGGAEQAGAPNLREFVPWAAELARQRQFTQRGPAHELHQLRTALRLGRRVSSEVVLVVSKGGAYQASVGGFESMGTKVKHWGTCG